MIGSRAGPGNFLAVNPVNDFNRNLIEEFRANNGRVTGPFEGAPLVLLTTTGAKSGRKRVNPLMALAEGDTLYVFGSKAGATTNPDWYHNLRAHPEVEVEFGAERFAAEAVPVTGPERDRLFAAQKAQNPAFGDYEKTTRGRVIPVVELRRTT
jgi:deazaflavin-dependent oxidoreductase (nitroreductase family)